MTTTPPHITAAERDALYANLVASLTGIGDVYRAIEEEDWAQADRLSGQFSDYLRLIQDLGWGDLGGPVTLSTPPDVLRSALLRLKDRADSEYEEDVRERGELDRQIRRIELVREVCERELANLEEPGSVGEAKA